MPFAEVFNFIFLEDGYGATYDCRRNPITDQKIVKSTNAWRVIKLKATENSKKWIEFKMSSSLSDRRNVEFNRKQIRT